MKILFATSNPHKVREANGVGEGFGVEFIQLMEPYPEIRDEDVSKVAEEGAKFVFEGIQESVIVEDTGLFIDVLNGFPGSYSAFVYGKIGNQGILQLLGGRENRNARFISAIGYCDLNGVKIFQGSVEGVVSDEVEGTAGFGYDPLFIPKGQTKTFAQDPVMKSRVSHRKKAFEKFCRWVIEGMK
jgi:XTP/dITP diphosphohydrolase